MISAVLLAWHRPENIRRIAEQLAALVFLDEILAWRNDPTVPLPLPSPKARIIESLHNIICLGRYRCAVLARHPLIYVQDDDLLVHDIPALLQQSLADPTRIHFNLSHWHCAHRTRHLYGDCHAALVGWGAIFHQCCLRVLDRLPDEVRSTRLFQREADLYFSVLQRRHHAARLGELTQPEGHSAPDVALSLARRAMNRSLPARWHVTLTCRDHAHVLPEAIESVILSSEDYELTVVDEASTDDTPCVATELRASRTCNTFAWRREQVRGAQATPPSLRATAPT